MRYGLRHGGHGDGVQPAQTAQLAGGVAEAIEHHGAHQRLDVELALAGAHGAPQGTVETKLLPEFVQSEDVTEALRGLMGDLARSILQPADSPVQPED